MQFIFMLTVCFFLKHGSKSRRFRVHDRKLFRPKLRRMLLKRHKLLPMPNRLQGKFKLLLLINDLHHKLLQCLQWRTLLELFFRIRAINKLNELRSRMLRYLLHILRWSIDLWSMRQSIFPRCQRSMRHQLQ